MSITPQGMSILNLYSRYREQKLIVNRRYQRKLVWTKAEKASLIESILLSYPIPLILFGKFKSSDSNDEDMYEIIDGMQRLNAIFSFIENEFAVKEKFFDVSKHPLANELSQRGVFIKTDTELSNLLSSSKCVKFLEYSLAVTLYEADSSKEIQDVFNRINANGRHLSPQEVRQAGVTTSFSGLVRSIASEIRGDISREVLPLTDMPEISIDSKSIKLGYGVLAEDTFWCNQGILSSSDLRNSDDEQILADIILSIALKTPFSASKDNFDSYYGRNENDKSDDITIAIAKYGENNLRADIKTVFSSIKDAITIVTENNGNKFLRDKLSPNVGNTIKQPFYTLFMAFYELIINESKEPFLLPEIFLALDNLKKCIDIRSTTNSVRVKNINITKGLIQSYFKSSNTTLRSSGSYALDFENYLRRSKVEAANYDFKQGLFTLNPDHRKFNDETLEKICQNLAAIANLGKGKKGYIFIGVSDNEQDTLKIEELDNIKSPRFFSFGIVGLEREAKLKGVSLDDYILLISRKIRESQLPEWLKTTVNTNLTPITYMNHTVLMIETKAGNEPVWYAGKLYIRDGHEKKPQQVSGEQIAAVYALFK